MGLLIPLRRAGFVAMAEGIICFGFLEDGSNMEQMIFNMLSGAIFMNGIKVTLKFETDNSNFGNEIAISGHVISDFESVEAFLHVEPFRILNTILYIAMYVSFFIVCRISFLPCPETPFLSWGHTMTGSKKSRMVAENPFLYFLCNPVN